MYPCNDTLRVVIVRPCGCDCRNSDLCMFVWQVSVRALPRCDTVPFIPCTACQAEGEEEPALGACAAPLPGPGPGLGPGLGPGTGLEGAADQW